VDQSFKQEFILIKMMMLKVFIWMKKFRKL
jgi:hypothetical protein